MSDHESIKVVDLGGLLGIFLRMDITKLEDLNVELEQYLISLGPQLRILARQSAQTEGVGVTQYLEVGREEWRKKLTQCRYCEEMFYCRSDMVNHQTRKHPSFPVRAGRRTRKSCPQCNKMVINLPLHVRNKHEMDTVNTAQGLAQCRLCADSYPIGEDHSSVCRLSPVCPVCNKTFSQWRVMNKHRRIVHLGIKMGCPHCSKEYHDSQSLKKHVDAVHLKIKKMCPICGVSVTSLPVHMNSVHTGLKNFPCSECGKKFKSNYALTRHRDSVHLGHKAGCPYCGKQLSNMRQHIRVVHKQIRFPCNICKKQLTTKAELRKHATKCHYQNMGDMVGGLQFQDGEDMEDQIQQYLGRQQFHLPDEGEQLDSKPDIRNLIARNVEVVQPSTQKVEDVENGRSQGLQTGYH